MTRSYERELGAIGEAMKNMDGRMDDAEKARHRLESKLEEHAGETTRKFAQVNASLQEIKDVMSELKGGWKAMTIMAGMGGAAGAFITYWAKIFLGLAK